MLGDCTRVTFNALDTGVIDGVDIFKGFYHVKSIGQVAKEFMPESGFLFNKVFDDGSSTALLAPKFSKTSYNIGV